MNKAAGTIIHLLYILPFFHFRLSMKPFGIKVLCIEPGFFKTNVTNAAILSKNVKMVWDKMPQEVRDDYGDDYLKACKFAHLFDPLLDFNVFIYFCMHSFLFFAHPGLAVITDKVAKMSDADLMKVVHCMEHAVAAVRPRTRYSPGWDAKLFWLPLSYMPSCVQDYILSLEAIPIARQQQ